jgi:hypothetical protein
MLCVVEIPIRAEAEHLIDEMDHMRTLLDHMHYQPVAFCQLHGRLVCRLDFTDEAQATRFATAFSGRLLDTSAV